MLVRYPPKVKAGTKPEQMVLSIDLAPTMLDLAGVKPNSPLQGQSWAPIFNGTVQDWRNSFLVEYYSDIVMPRIVKMGYKAVRNERYKYIHYLELQGMNELYDLVKDPFELHNVIDDPSMATVLREMQEELNQCLEKTGAERLP
ncbi:MAG: DUF4976 domain-containing protein [Lewinellaceae bacterium]|nr:DUF4976 domain-containing protein [Lewinellaceae bacterium]